MADPDFSLQLEQIFTMMTPADLAGTLKLNLGQAQSDITGGPFAVLQSIIENDGRGVLATTDIIAKLNALTTGTDAPTQDDLKRFFDVHSTKGQTSFHSVTDDLNQYSSSDGSPKQVASVAEIIGSKFQIDPTVDVLFMCSRSPFFNPATRHTRRVEIFLNSMPSIILQQMVPLLDVEFQVVKASSTGLPYLSNLRFLLGDVDPKSLAGTANQAMLEGKQVTGGDQESDFAGMEMFTSPQTMVNPTPNFNSSGAPAGRYTEINDPFRPFASIESLSINIKGTVGMMQYKTAHLTIKLHDRSRLAEISDLIRPQAYGNVTLWLTYGWRAPLFKMNDPTGVPYFDFINNNMLMREAYGIVNASFAFDQVGQVTINLELATKGGQEVKTMPITHALDVEGKATSYGTMKTIKDLAEQIARYRKRLKLDPPEGINKEIRAYQILDAASIGEFPTDLKASDVAATIDQLNKQLTSKADPDADAIKGLITSLKTLYSKDQKTNKFSLQERVTSLATSEVAAKFLEAQTGPDPYLLDDSKKGEKAASPLCTEVKKYQILPKGKVTTYRRKLVSFGKLFATFAVPVILQAKLCEEVQIFFYSLNSQCGPVSGHSIAEFPIDMEVFLSQYTDHVVRRGGENITLDEFLGLVINAQVLDNRSVGYGLRSYYEPWSPGKDAQVNKNKEKDFEGVLANWSKTNGPFRQPSIAMVLEVSHKRSVTDGQSDILASLAYSAKDSASVVDKDVQANNFRRIMRIHIYDKTVNPYAEATMLLKSDDGHHFIQAPSNDYVKQLAATTNVSTMQAQLSALKGIQQDVTTGAMSLPTEFSNARQIKDVVSKMVPTLTYGANGTTIISANLSTKAESLLSTVNMMRSNTIKNASQPNGSGEGGIPLRVIPAQLSMTTMGCPLGHINQYYFIDFNTGTSIDNLYGCTSLQHTLAAGKFESQWTFGYADAYGVFEGAPNIVDQITKLSADIPKKS